jgi:hypothetical protein
VAARGESFTISGAECVVALCALGFGVAKRLPGRTIVCTERKRITVPDLVRLPRPALTGILRAAGVTYSTLVRALDERPTESELRVVASRPPQREAHGTVDDEAEG